ncbi:Glucuronosyltransferase 47 A [Actinidia chinensis var. chinensis]|uniref:Glucuronosyltransferase 47 A n=1 Tax=Actinidia chinensis var. chinensis TaxID=1590841 RepID=A0A2R6R594_ACTCC|nr:Glucuronosyltransferase 47 A [Actinidia chinensis var. chinensis]
MDYVQRWKCSWSLVATVASMVVLVSVVHVFLFPVVPSFDYLSVRHAQNSCIPINESTKGGKDDVLNLDAWFPADLHKAVIYRSTPWKSKIGRWLSGCNPIITTIKVVENIGGKSCNRDCSGQGICNYDLGHCRCFHGFSGEGCSEKLHLDCNYPGSKDQPYGHWVVSICPAYCDTTRAMCFCGEGTKYPNRPVAEACGFKMSLPSELDGPKLTDWTKADLDNIFTTNDSRSGWCNVDPAEAYASRVQFKEECDCKYDCLWGRFCEVPVQCTCINQCSGHGYCRSGFCQKHNGLRSSLTLEFYKRAYDHIVEQYPFWNRSSGRDHIWFFSWDEGACYAPKEIWNSMMLVHWGNTNSKHNHSTTAYWADNWDHISSDRRGNHPCFDPDKDLVLPAWKRPDINSLSLKLWARPREIRKTLFYFNGNLGPAYEKGRPEATYSMGIRQKVAEEFGSTPNKEGKLGKQHAEDVIVTPLHSENYHDDLASSVFCGVMPGDGWSGRMEDSILQGCIPVVIQDGIYLPYENVLNYESFAVRIQEDEIPDLIKILRGFNETEIEFRLANVQKIWQRFVYRDSIMLEADRQKAAFGRVDDWAVKFLQLVEDDVIATVIQVLHYKLHNDPWRRQLAYTKKDFGVPQECLIKN